MSRSNRNRETGKSAVSGLSAAWLLLLSFPLLGSMPVLAQPAGSTAVAETTAASHFASEAGASDHTPINRSSGLRKRPAGIPAPESSSGWWFGTAGIALVLAGCGGICLAAKKYLPQSSSPLLRVVGRVSLSPKHSVYLLRVEGRVLLIGAGPQGAPSYLGELTDTIRDEADSTEPRLSTEASPVPKAPASAIKKAAVRPLASRGKSRFDVQVGDDE